MSDEKNFDVIIVGAGLAGLSCAYELSAKGKRVLVLEAHAYAGGRTASFDDNGMKVESGLHRYIGYYSALPKLLKKSGAPIGSIVTWEDKVDILIKDENKKLVLGLAPVFGFGKLLKSLFGNRDILSWRDKLSLVPFFLCGFTSYFFSGRLDNFSVTEYAERHHVSERAKRLVLEPLSSGIFFMPPENYSAYAFFGLFAPAIPKFYKMRIGAYLGGMTEVMCNPIVRRVEALGGVFRFRETVQEVFIKEGKAAGVKAEGGQEYYAPLTVIASTLPSAKKILKPLKNGNASHENNGGVSHGNKRGVSCENNGGVSHGSKRGVSCENNDRISHEINSSKLHTDNGGLPRAKSRELDKLFRLPEMSACTFQAELDSPAFCKDITTFGPGTDMVSFAEQSRSTFRGSKGRLSVILGNPREYADKSAEEILPAVLEQLESLGVQLEGHITDYRKVAEKNEFYSLDKGNQCLRPRQKTEIPGLVLAGDYTLTSSFATMEGAVLSGKKAAKQCLKQLRKI